ncbi:hypothetical protein J9B83_10860 [Marinomonas sp. A79]|uniref:Toxin CptA n=1 Tax=Marinomonas vulgaris TaxID=2823372 RepID=A0ABS5HCQ5_9GAMM|nr:hypothetical protein [Marinomonas vulgaris]MBR7889441.1 hypothetical protein [Marinomonas vulgaris]
MFSLKATELKRSTISTAVWLMVTLCYLALLKLFWMPTIWWALLLLAVAIVWLAVGVIGWRQPAVTLSLHEDNAILCRGSQCQSLIFVRFNALQLIAKINRGSRWQDLLWPKFQVIYRDSLSPEDYQIVRSFAAQQILLHRSEENKG